VVWDAYPDNDLVHDWRQFLSVSVIGIGGGIAVLWQTFSLNKSTANMVLMKWGEEASSTIYHLSQTCTSLFSVEFKMYQP
jgi:hypothetical protein